ncbi:hypothetical protein JTB14_005834 [Gonioctena quinquepunctata]|nr:hypothetical protein JTB14_005834 [Gonioctena quinquepunctata]
MTNQANSEEFIRNFIEIYHRHPALWKIKSRSYTDRKSKESGHNELVELYKKIDSFANVETVKKKINNLRSAFRKELKKVKKSTRSGASTSSVYKPTLWYYNLLFFTCDQAEAREGQSNEDSESEEINDTQDEECEDIITENVYSPEGLTSALSTTSSSRPTSRISETPTANRVKKQKLDDKKKEELLQNITTKLDEKEDEFDVTGKHIANKLRNVSRDQMIYAEKIIMDVLFQAQLGTLNRDSQLQVNQERSPQQDNNCPSVAYSDSPNDIKLEGEVGTYLQLP